MKIVIFGASGRTGSIILEMALTEGHYVTAYIRSKRSIVKRHANLKYVVGQLNDNQKLKEAISGADACFSALGGNSLIHHSPEIIEGIDSIVNVMESEGVKRFIYLSSIGAGESRSYMPLPLRFLIADLILRVPLADHTKNENRIYKSSLQWTVIRPGGLNDNDVTDIISYGCEKTHLIGSPSISRASVAVFMLQQLTDLQFINRCVWIYE
jgi:nucleoside-diphosphate-sugar epimerase